MEKKLYWMNKFYKSNWLKSVSASDLQSTTTTDSVRPMMIIRDNVTFRAIERSFSLILNVAFGMNADGFVDFCCLFSSLRQIFWWNHVNNSSIVGVSHSSWTMDTISARHSGQYCNCDAHVIQKPLNWNNQKRRFNLGILFRPRVRQIYMSLLGLYQTEFRMVFYLCEQGSSRTMPFKSKHSVQESSRTLSFRNCSRNKWRGNTTLSWSLRYACELKLSKDRLFGGNLNGSEPKLNRHCWNDIHEAAAKKPSLLEELNCC